MALDTDPERWRQISLILDEALELEPERRPAFLDRACPDPDLRGEVEALLAADSTEDPLLDTPAESLMAPVLEEMKGQGEIPLWGAWEGRSLGPYRVERLIGGGGMGVVYEALDTRLDRPVAVKLLPPEWSRDPAAKERFVREARTASALDHPAICTIHDVGESDDGQLYIVMAYYAGKTLAREIEQGPMSIDLARSLALQIARGLERAHQAGVVHRDIKPANIMITEHSEAKVLDFGIAKMAGEVGLTKTGSSVGTPAYMSPEQTGTGDEIDGRTDVWSLGVLLYEMLSGRRPFVGEHPQAVIRGILEEEPPSLRSLRPEIDASLERVVARALAKDPDHRYPNMEAFRVALETGNAPRTLVTIQVPEEPHRPLAALGLLLLLLTVGWWAWREASPDRKTEPVAAAARTEAAPVVGVVPFRNQTGDDSLGWYGGALAQLISDQLAQSRHLHVLSTRRMETLLESAGSDDLTTHAAAAEVDYLLTGELLAVGEGLTLSARLVATEGDRQTASERLDGLRPQDLFLTVDDIASEARKGLGVPLSETIDVLAADFAAANPEAYEHYIAGLREFLAFRYEPAERSFTAALEAAPDFTMARYRLAQIALTNSRFDVAAREIATAKQEIDRLSDRDARYVRALEATIERRYDDAMAAYRELIDQYPYETEARYQLALLAHDTGRFEEVFQPAEELARLEPESHVTWSLMGSAHLALGNLNQAVVDLERFVELEPGSANGHHLLADAYRAQDELELAAVEYGAALEADPSFHFSAVALATLDVLRGRFEAAEERLLRLTGATRLAPRHRIDAGFALTSLYRAAGRFREAAEVFAGLEEPLAAEQIREAHALSWRGLSLLEIDRHEEARRLLDLAVERNPGVPTRYLFARGLFELATGRMEAVEATARAILEHALPPENPDRTEEKAAACLRGRALLAAGRAEGAVAELSRAVALEGFEYRGYRLDLARAYLAAGQPRRAMAAARQASEESRTEDRFLELELDRVRALLVLAQVQEALGQPQEARRYALRFLDRWAEADPGLPDLDEARRLASLG